MKTKWNCNSMHIICISVLPECGCRKQPKHVAVFHCICGQVRFVSQFAGIKTYSSEKLITPMLHAWNAHRLGQTKTSAVARIREKTVRCRLFLGGPLVQYVTNVCVQLSTVCNKRLCPT